MQNFGRKSAKKVLVGCQTNLVHQKISYCTSPDWETWSISILEYMGFRARLHQMSLAPVWNDFWRLWWPMISGNGWGLCFPDICLTVEEEPRENLNQENWAYRGSNPGPLKTLGKSCRSCRSVSHELTPQQAQHRVDICRQLIGNPEDNRFIRRIVPCYEKYVYYHNPDASKQWLGPRKPAKSSLKKIRFGPKVMLWLVEFWRCHSLGICSKRECSRCGSLFSTTGTSSWNFETELPSIR